jgi:ABC-type proline/glycine betaine transport system permease subunit
MHILNYLTDEERARYFARRDERMAQADLLEKSRLWLHPYHHIILVLGLVLSFTIVGSVLGICMMCMACWIQGSMGKWGFLLSLPLGLANLALFVVAGITQLIY